MMKIEGKKGGLKLAKTDKTICGLFEYFLRQWCAAHVGEDTVFLTDDNGKLIFKATLLDKEN